MIKTLTTVGFSALLLFACGDKKEGGESATKGDPELAAEAVDVAKRFCECPDSACASEVRSASGKKPYDIFFQSPTKNLNKEEMAQWQESRSKWNECGKPSYKRAGGAAPAAADPAAADPAAADPAAAAGSDAAPAAE